jgi:hypothetical protein
MKSKNYTYYSKDEELLKRLRDEYIYSGRQCEIQGDRLVVFALPQKKAKGKEARGTRRR